MKKYQSLLNTSQLNIALIVTLNFLMMNCQSPQKQEQEEKALTVEIYETSASGNQLSKIEESSQAADSSITIKLNPEEKFQKITGFGGSFTESSAYLLNKLGKENREKVLNAYFSEEGANYSLTRTHINSCDFSLGQYSYAPVPGDTALTNFSIKEDMDDLIPMIKDAQRISKDGFKIISSPWTAPPWMKDNNAWVGGKLLPEYREAWALFFSKYLTEYKKQGIEIWGLTVENEPHGNGNNWESMLYSPKEMTDFVQDFLGPKLEKDGYGDIKILGYDQNRAGLKEWVDEMYRDAQSSKYFAGTAIHWYESTYDYFPEDLQYAHNKAPDKYLIQTEACVDSEIPHWKDDAWYWSKEATDWGWDWASEEEKHLHPKYVPTYRYARDIIGCLNNQVDGWVDWNMVLDKQGGPNWFKNWCVAPVIVDPEADEVYLTPLYYVMAHFSKFIRPGAVRIGFENSDKNLMATAAQNPDGSIAVVLLNQSEKAASVSVQLGEKQIAININAQAIQTLIITP
jgi:glucosylceramidase